MIVRRFGDRLQLITQPDHAQLAGTIMESCVSLQAEPRRAAILRAVFGHDNGWQDEDDAPRINPATGEMYDFVSAPLSVRQGVWPRAVARFGNDSWTAALIAQHAITVYDRFRPNSEWDAFFAGMQAERDNRLAAGEWHLDDLLHDYQYVRLGDLISLTFCTGWSDEQRFREYTVRRSGTCVVVSPDVFGGAEVQFSIAAREMSDGRFESDTDLRRSVRDAKAITLTGAVSGPMNGVVM